MRSPVDAIRTHWPEYLIEAAGLGLFMVSASVATTALEHPHSPLHAAVPDPLLRRILIGICMGLTAIGLIYSPWGKQSGAHLNPAVTLTFLRLGKIEGIDASFYMIAQSLGGLIGVLVSVTAIGMAIEHPAVNYVVTVPGETGISLAFVAELLMSFGLMLSVLLVSNHRTLAPFTGLIAGCLVATYISIEAPFSGMSMNPARTFASALPANLWTAFWVYLTAPPLGMLMAAELYVRTKSLKNVYCAKLHHQNAKRCIFHCDYKKLLRAGERSSDSFTAPLT
ncbi:MAG TPA: aquaporin [Nitrospira sp.]|nr:aquaporin [Nitrospira sp.]